MIKETGLNGSTAGGVLHAGNVLMLPSKMPEVLVPHVFFTALTVKAASVCIRSAGFILHLLQKHNDTNTHDFTEILGRTGTFRLKKKNVSFSGSGKLYYYLLHKDCLSSFVLQ